MSDFVGEMTTVWFSEVLFEICLADFDQLEYSVLSLSADLKR